MVRTIAKDHSEKRDHILRKAAEVFARDGITRASMKQVADHCGISKANIYHYYGSKDELVFDILDNYLESLTTRVTSIDLDGLNAEQKFKAVFREIILAYDGMDNEHKIQTEGLPLLPKDKQDTLKTHQRKLVNFVEKIIEDVLPSSHPKSAGTIRDLTMSVFGMLNWFYMWNYKADKNRRSDYSDIVSELCLKGMPNL